MVRRSWFSAVIATLAISASPAFAQQAPPLQSQTTPPITWPFGEFYLRGDAGGAFSGGTNFHSANPTAGNALLGSGQKLTGNTGNNDIFDLGIGSRITALPYLRWDATLSYLPSLKYSGSGAVAHMNSWVGMVNGYVDLNRVVPPNTFGLFEPYVDAGIGAASNTVNSMYASSLGGGTGISGNTQTSFAYGLGAGVAYPIAPRLKLDLSYRYLNLGDAQTSTVGNGSSIQPLKADLKEHAVMLGVRYDFQ